MILAEHFPRNGPLHFQATTYFSQIILLQNQKSLPYMHITPNNLHVISTQGTIIRQWEDTDLLFIHSLQKQPRFTQKH